MPIINAGEVISVRIKYFQTDAETERKSPLFSAKEKFWIGLGAVATMAAAYGIFQVGRAQENGIRNSLAVEAAAQIPGFAGITEGGKTPQTIFEEVRSATVGLETGETCDIQYTTYAEGLLGKFGENRGHIVSLGTCALRSE